MKAEKIQNSPGIAVQLLLLSLLAFGSTAHSAESWNIDMSKLKGRIVRALSVANFDSNLIIVGNKGSQAGDATVFASSNGGVTWRFLNRNASLHPSATDVQAVHYVSPQIVLAGTWKHGLFRSTDAGTSFSAVTGFAPKDVRSIVTSGSAVYAATGANGIFKSNDSGSSWSTTTLNEGFFWSLRARAGGSELAASSPAKGLFLSRDNGNSWQNYLEGVAVYEANMSPQTAAIIVAATDSGMYLSRDAGQQWQQPQPLRGKKLRSVNFDPTDPSIVILADWGGGIWRYSLSDNSASQFQNQLRALHVKSNGQALIVGTWGQGLHVLPHSSNTSYLIEATKAGDKGGVSELLSSGAHPDSYDTSRNTSLIFASRDGQLELAKTLLQSGANVNWVDGEGVTPLILAAHKNHPDIVELLLANNADTTVVDSFGNTAVQYAKRRGDNDKIYKLLTQ